MIREEADGDAEGVELLLKILHDESARSGIVAPAMANQDLPERNEHFAHGAFEPTIDTEFDPSWRSCFHHSYLNSCLPTPRVSSCNQNLLSRPSPFPPNHYSFH